MDNKLVDWVTDSTFCSDHHTPLSPFKFESYKHCANHPLKQQLSHLLDVQPTSLPSGNSMRRTEQLKSHLMLNFEAAFVLANDGNSFYRLVGIEHIKYMIGQPQRLAQLETLVAKDSFDLKLLQNVPERFLFLDKLELFSLITDITASLTSKNSPSTSEMLLRAISQNQHLEFAIIAFYRLLTYVVGYINIQSQLSMLLQGNQEQSILTYGDEVTPLVVKIVAESLSASINIYTLMRGEIQETSFGLQFSQHHKFAISILLLQNHYTLLSEKQKQMSDLPIHTSASSSSKCARPRIKLDIREYVPECELEGLDDEFFQSLYESMGEEERKSIILQYIRENYSISQ